MGRSMSTFFWVLGLYCFSAAIFTFFTGFGIQLLLTPLLLFFFPLDRAVVIVSVVHLAYAGLQFALARRNTTPLRNIDWEVVVRFGVPAAVASAVGALCFFSLRDVPPYLLYALSLKVYALQVFTLACGICVVVFTGVMLARLRLPFRREPGHLALGGALAGFFGGAVGLSDPIREAALAPIDRHEVASPATVALISILIDLPRIILYTPTLISESYPLERRVFIAALLGAGAGMFCGRSVLRIGVRDSTRRTTGFALMVVGFLLAGGLLSR